jgi:N-acetylmuramoyl-L-alanine amidase
MPTRAPLLSVTVCKPYAQVLPCINVLFNRLPYPETVLNKGRDKTMKKAIFALAALATLTTTAKAQTVTIDPVDALTNPRTCMALNLYHEARGEPVAGMIAVFEVVLARVKSAKFPDDICGVVWQQHVKPNGVKVGQFSWTADDRIDNVVDANQWADVQDFMNGIVTRAIEVQYRPNVLYYHAGPRTGFFQKLKFQYQVGAHKFYSEG